MQDNSGENKQVSLQDKLLAEQYDSWKQKCENDPEDVFAYFAKGLVERYMLPQSAKDVHAKKDKPPALK